MKQKIKLSYASLGKFLSDSGVDKSAIGRTMLYVAITNNNENKKEYKTVELYQGCEAQIFLSGLTNLTQAINQKDIDDSLTTVIEEYKVPINDFFVKNMDNIITSGPRNQINSIYDFMHQMIYHQADFEDVNDCIKKISDASGSTFYNFALIGFQLKNSEKLTLKKLREYYNPIETKDGTAPDIMIPETVLRDHHNLIRALNIYLSQRRM